MKTFSFAEAVKYLNTSETVLTDLASKGQIRGAKIGQRWVFREDDLDEYLRSEVDRQTAERLNAVGNGVKAKVKTGYGNRTPLADLSKHAA